MKSQKKNSKTKTKDYFFLPPEDVAWFSFYYTSYIMLRFDLHNYWMSVYKASEVSGNY